MKCTWVDCHKEAIHKELNREGKPWANLCDDHHKKLTEAIESGLPPKICSVWVKAHGGSKKMLEDF